MAGRRLLKACALIASLSTVIFPLNAWAQSCDAIWGNAVQTHNAPGTVSVGYNAKFVTANPELQVASLLSNSGSSVPSCNTQACVALGTLIDGFTLPAFEPATAGVALNVGWQGQGTLGELGASEFTQVTTGSESTLQVAQGIESFHIGQLTLGWRSTLVLQPGHYWVDSLIVNSETTIEIAADSGSDPVIIYVNQPLTLGWKNMIIGDDDNASRLVIVSYSDITLNSEAEVHAQVYAQNKLTLNSKAALFGSAVASQVDLFSEAVITYQQPSSNLVVGQLCGLEVLDADNDGVLDDVDSCPNTPEEETVDANGCSASQLDSDSDGVSNNIDICPGTELGAIVNGDGCALTQLDSDLDGWNDAVDQCPNTPLTETADMTGCSLSQKDSDLDGVNDHVDICPATAQGNTVDVNGCSVGQLDDDSDGVANSNDVCANTPVTETANTEGCAPSQLDSDNDGINDRDDACSGNTPYDHVGTDGCTVEERDTDGDGVPDIEDPTPDDPNGQALPKVTIDSPENLTTFGTTSVEITGTVDVNAASLTVNGQPINFDAAGFYSAQVTLSEGHNVITSRMVMANDVVSTASISVSLDKTAPYITLESHEDGDVVYQPEVTVTGLVNDIVRGTVEADQAIVTVNGVNAEIANRSYAATITLQPGSNTITVLAVDQVNNQSEPLTFTLTYQQPDSLAAIQILSGTGQSGVIGSLLAEPISVQVLDANGNPAIGKNVVFRVVQGSGVVAAETAEPKNGVVLTTDSNGIATTQYQLGLRSGVANHKIAVRVVGYPETIITASATGADADKVSVNSGNNQYGEVYQPLPAPFVVSVTDNGANVVQGVHHWLPLDHDGTPMRVVVAISYSTRLGLTGFTKPFIAAYYAERFRYQNTLRNGLRMNENNDTFP